jgi:ABC-type dipeptide/oligopeptide/nickel transport system permease subunit
LTAGRRRLGNLGPLAAVLAVAATAALLVHAPPNRLDPARAWSAPSFANPLGCGEAGVDLLSLVANAVLRGVALAVVVSVFGFAIGTPLGAAAALRRGRFERFIDRACDLLQSFPTFLLALAVLSAVASPTRVHLGCVFGLTAWAPFARLSLAQTRVVREAAFLEASVALGAGRARVLLRHVLPNVIGVAAVQLGAAGATIVVSEAAFAFVGFGPSDGVSLGNVMDQGVAAMLRAPHVLVVGALAVFGTSAAMLWAGKAVE